MPFNLLLLPLLGGYIFLRYWNPTRYHALRADKERLIILAAIPGFISLVITFFVMRLGQYLFPCQPNHFCFQTWWMRVAPFDYIGTAMSALLLAGLIWIPLNRFKKCSRDAAIDRMIDQDGVALDVLLKEAQSLAKTVSVTMSNGKVYVGFVVHIFNPAFPTKFIRILPTKSGYRDDFTKEFHFTNFYSTALDDMERDFDRRFREWESLTEQLEANRRATPKPGPEETSGLETRIASMENELDELSLEVDDFGVVLPVDQIDSINIFSEYVYQKYFTRPAIAPLRTQ